MSQSFSLFVGWCKEHPNHEVRFGWEPDSGWWCEIWWKADPAGAIVTICRQGTLTGAWETAKDSFYLLI